jgi:serine/threonine protein kinase
VVECVQDAIDRGLLRVHPSGPANITAILQTARDMAAGMAYLHSLDILHGDLTAVNILLAAADTDARGFRAKVIMHEYLPQSTAKTYHPHQAYHTCFTHSRMLLSIHIYALVGNIPQWTIRRLQGFKLWCFWVLQI